MDIAKLKIAPGHDSGGTKPSQENRGRPRRRAPPPARMPGSGRSSQATSQNQGRNSPGPRRESIHLGHGQAIRRPKERLPDPRRERAEKPSRRRPISPPSRQRPGNTALLALTLTARPYGCVPVMGFISRRPARASSRISWSRKSAASSKRCCPISSRK